MPDNTLNPQQLAPLLSPLTDSANWYVAFSGGLDSTVLLHLLHRWCQVHPNAPTLVAIHINHGLQAGADDWQAHCQEICDDLDVAFLPRTVAVKQDGRGLESAAREGRYQAFEELLGTSDVLFMGHHQDDQVETFFLRLLRGAGLDGLSSMPASRRLGEGMLQRPLLAFSREQLASYASAQQLTFIEDPSNVDVSLDRNFLRQQVLPLLATRWPAYRGSVERAVQQLASAAGELEQLQELPVKTVNGWGDPGLSLLEVNANPEQLPSLLRRWLQGLDLPMPDRTLLLEFTRQLREADATANPRLDSGSYVLQRYRDTVYLLPDPKDWQPPGEITLQAGQRITLAGIGELELVPTEGLGLVLVPGQPLSLRWRQGGERCRPITGKQSVSIKQLLQEAAVPPWWRQRLPLLFDGQQLLAVGDLCLCQSALVRSVSPEGESNWALRWNRNSLAPEV